MKKLRLLITKECNRNCEGCCNKIYDLDKLPICNSFEGYDEIILTGGEPLLKIDLVYKTFEKIMKENPFVRVYLYTAKVDNHGDMYDILQFVNGITVTLHEQSDVDKFILFNNRLNFKLDNLSLRLHVFEGVNISKLDEIDLKNWQVKKNIKWIKNCPLPKDEVFMRLENI
jgi:hypothetical protein